jgi:hypothetical protein
MNCLVQILLVRIPDAGSSLSGTGVAASAGCSPVAPRPSLRPRRSGHRFARAPLTPLHRTRSHPQAASSGHLQSFLFTAPHSTSPHAARAHCMARLLTLRPPAPEPLAAAGLSPLSAPRARPVTSALHHASTLSRPPTSAAAPRRSTTARALGAATCAGAREGEARRREGGAPAHPAPRPSLMPQLAASTDHVAARTHVYVAAHIEASIVDDRTRSPISPTPLCSTRRV